LRSLRMNSCHTMPVTHPSASVYSPLAAVIYLVYARSRSFSYMDHLKSLLAVLLLYSSPTPMMVPDRALALQVRFGPSSCPYSPNVVEGEFSEVRIQEESPYAATERPFTSSSAVPKVPGTTAQVTLPPPGPWLQQPPCARMRSRPPRKPRNSPQPLETATPR
jgi:hypothetical protein